MVCLWVLLCSCVVVVSIEVLLCYDDGYLVID